MSFFNLFFGLQLVFMEVIDVNQVLFFPPLVYFGQFFQLLTKL
jgi:hypothetical protein